MVPPLLVGIGALLVSLLFFGVATALVVQVVVRLIRSGFAGLGFWKNVVVMMIVTLITVAMHLTQIALWAVILLVCGEISTFEKAFYVSAENYTALGYGDVILSERWRLLGPLEAINGLLLFGLSTALLFAVMSHLIANNLRHQFGKRAEEKLPDALDPEVPSERVLP
jgi:Ion channel